MTFFVNILCDYREVTELDVNSEDVNRIVAQDKRQEPLFDKSKCAVVTTDDLVYGMSRMWEILSDDTRLTTEVFRDINDALKWLGLDLDSFDWMERPSLRAVNGDTHLSGVIRAVSSIGPWFCLHRGTGGCNRALARVEVEAICFMVHKKLKSVARL